jgi:hypothetical protein
MERAENRNHVTIIRKDLQDCAGSPFSEKAAIKIPPTPYDKGGGMWMPMFFPTHKRGGKRMPAFFPLCKRGRGDFVPHAIIIFELRLYLPVRMEVTTWVSTARDVHADNF